MGAYGSPEHLPGEDQEPQYQYGYTKPLKKGILYGDLKPWQKAILIIYCIILGFFGLIMIVGVGNYQGNKAVGALIAVAFIALGILFATKINSHKTAWPFILCSVIAFFIYWGTSSNGQPTQVAAATPQSAITQSSTLTSSKPVNSSPAKTKSKANAVASSKQKTAPSKAPTDAVTQYKKQCTAYKYKTIARNPNDYKGMPAKFTGQVTQIEESWGSDVIRLNVTKDEYGIWSDTIYIDYTPKSENESRILENDIITVYGELDGIKTYTTVLGSDVSIPYLKAQYVDISSESK